MLEKIYIVLIFSFNKTNNKGMKILYLYLSYSITYIYLIKSKNYIKMNFAIKN